MTINKYQGKTKEEAVEKAKQELGAGAVVLNVKEIKPKGMFKMFKNTLYEVTAAVEEKEAFPAQTLRSETKPVHDTISLAADEKITIPGVARENTRPAVAPAPAEQEVVPMKEAKRESTNEGLEAAGEPVEYSGKAVFRGGDAQVSSGRAAGKGEPHGRVPVYQDALPHAAGE